MLFNNESISSTLKLSLGLLMSRGSRRPDIKTLADSVPSERSFSTLNLVHLKLWNPRQVSELEYIRLLTAEFYKTVSRHLRLKLLKSGPGVYRVNQDDEHRGKQSKTKILNLNNTRWCVPSKVFFSANRLKEMRVTVMNNAESFLSSQMVNR